TGPYRELYVSALERIQTLELHQETFHSLNQAMQLMCNTLMSIKSETEEALSSMKELEGIVSEDQKTQSHQLGQMKTLFARCMEMLKKMEQKTKVCVKNRDDMKKQMEEALEKESTVFRVLEQLRVHHTTQVSDLQYNLGSHEELTDTLTHTYPQLVRKHTQYERNISLFDTLLLYYTIM
ncbi:sperm-associated antigen 5, partial [Tachysurus ichikawai]